MLTRETSALHSSDADALKACEELLHTEIKESAERTTIRRLVYAVPCAAQGALGSRYRLHTERSLNHHFQVFRGLCRAEFEQLVPAAGASKKTEPHT